MCRSLPVICCSWSQIYSQWLLLLLFLLHFDILFFAHCKFMRSFRMSNGVVICSFWWHGEWNNDSVKLNCSVCVGEIWYFSNLSLAANYLNPLICLPHYLLIVPLKVARGVTFLHTTCYCDYCQTEKFKTTVFSAWSCILNYFIAVKLTVMVDGVDEPDSYMCMVICHQHNVKQLFTLWVQLPQSSVHRLQSL